MIQGESGAKFILSGEHSIVHQGLALAFPIQQITLKYAETDGNNEIFLNGKQIDNKFREKIIQLREVFKIQIPLQKVIIESDIPMGSGLGSSAALCHAILKAHHLNQSLESTLSLCHQGEKILHGRSSGVDPYTVVLGKAIVFQHNKEFRELNTQAFINSHLCFVLCDTGQAHQTEEIIHQQKILKEKSPQLWQEIIENLAKLSALMLPAFESHPENIASLMKDIDTQLKTFGVCNEACLQQANKLTQLGALATKITGAGMGGFILSLFEKEQAKKIAWEESFPGQRVIVYTL